MVVTNYGGIKPDLLESLVGSLQLTGNEGSSPQIKFVKLASDICRSRFKKGDRGVVVFVGLDGRPSQFLDNIETDAVPMLLSGNDEISNQLYFSDYSLDKILRYSTDTEITSTNYEEILEDLGFGDRVTFVADMRSDENAYVYINLSGVENGGRIFTELFHDSPISSEDIKSVLDKFYGYIKTPQEAKTGHKLGIWGDAAKGKPGTSPELQIQSRLLDWLRAYYLSHDVRAEGTNRLGRYDVRVAKKNDDDNQGKNITIEWVLELKALTEKTSSGRPKGRQVLVDAIDKGFDQAVAFKKEEHAVNSALCCYDMTKHSKTAEELLENKKAEQDKCDIHLWSWYLYRSSEHARKELVD